jgi:hypothetical protein
VQLIDDKAISRGMVKVESGEDLVESLQALAEAAGWIDAMVSGAGTLDLVELLAADGNTVTLENADLIALAGRIHRGPDGARLVALSASVSAGNSLHSGRITAAMTGGLLLVIDAVSERANVRSVPPQRSAGSTDRAATSPAAASPRPQGAMSPPPPPTFGDGRRSASKPLSQSFKTKPMVQPIPAPKFNLDDEDDENPILNPGDFVDHPQLGLCEVVADDDSGGTKIRVPSGKTRVLRLEALKVLNGVQDDEGRMVFKVTGPRKKRR